MRVENADEKAEPLRAVDYQPRTRLIFGAGAIERIGELTREISGKKILLVTDPGIVAAGHVERVRKLLEAAHLNVTLFDQARENPTTKCVESCVAIARSAGIDTIIGLGGGSAMDTAKGCNFILTNGGQMQDYWGVGKASKALLPLIAVPTTAGTGSECQSAALIADEKTHQKMACIDPKAAACIAILDPRLTLSQPTRVTACAGIDAIAHAVETAVTTKRNPLSQMFSHEAFKLCVKALPEILLNPTDLEARGRMQLGAAFAGLAIENSMLGAAHAAANPLTAHFGIVHGQAVGMMLSAVVRFNGEDGSTRQAYAELASAPEIASVTGHGHDHAWLALIKRLEALLALAEIPSSLEEFGIKSDAIPELAQEAARQWTAKFNPRPMTHADFQKLYEIAFHERESVLQSR